MSIVANILRCVTACCAFIEDINEINLQNLWFDGHTTHGAMKWKWAFMVPAWATCSYERTITVIWCVTCLVITSIVMFFESHFRYEIIVLLEKSYPLMWGLEIVHWTYLLMVAYFVSRILIILQFVNDSEYEMRSCVTPLPRLARVAWAAHCIALPSSVVGFIVCILFFADDSHHLTTLSYAVNAAVMVVDMICFPVPLEPMHIVWLFAMGMFYAFVVAPLHWLVQSHWPYIYEALNWNNPAQTVQYIALYTVFSLTIYAILSAWTRLRPRFANNPEYSRNLPVESGP